MTAKDLAARLMLAANLLRDIAQEYRDLTFTADQEALVWPIAFVVEDDGEVGLWCNKEGCLLDGHNSRIDIDTDNFTVTDLLEILTGHIEYNKERVNDQKEE